MLRFAVEIESTRLQTPEKKNWSPIAVGSIKETSRDGFVEIQIHLHSFGTDRALQPIFSRR
jgi:hypothetical protein